MHPPIPTIESEVLSRDGHQIHWEESGSPAGIPVLYLHGGPGASLTDDHRRHFDPELYRVIAIQQRGSGRSLPSAAASEHDLSTNTTRHLLDDISALRDHLGVERWLVAGSSWGSTLALHHAVENRERVLGLLLAAVTTTSPDEVEWITEGVSVLYPEAWEQLAGFVEQHSSWTRGSERLVDAVADIMTGDDQDLRREMAITWMAWEESHVQIGLPVEELAPVGLCELPIDQQVALTTLASHYWSHHAALDPEWVPEAGLLASLPALTGVELFMVHGRRDVSSPVSIPWRIKGILPDAQLHVVEHEGHGGPWMSHLVRHASDVFAQENSFAKVLQG